MTDSFLYAATRTPFGRYSGALAGVRPDDLAAAALRGLLARAPDLDPARIDDVQWGNANGAGEDNRNVGRMAVLLAGLPPTVPANTVNRLCGSSLDAAIIASRAIAAGDAEIVVAGGVESMTRAPWVLPKVSRTIPPSDATAPPSDAAAPATGARHLANPRMPTAWTESLGECNERLANRFGISRERQDDFAVRSHTLAEKAWTDGFYDDLVTPLGTPPTDPAGDVDPDSTGTAAHHQAPVPAGPAVDHRVQGPAGTVVDHRASVPAGTVVDHRAPGPAGTVVDHRAPGPAGTVVDHRAPGPAGIVVHNFAGVLTRDEGIRADMSPEKLARLKPSFRQDGTITEGNTSPLADGAAAILLGTAAAAFAIGYDPIARIAARAAHAVDPRDSGVAPVEAADKALRRAGITWSDVGAVELDEAYAVQSLACIDAWKINPSTVNTRGGAIAIGHPLGASGARLLATLAHVLRERDKRWGVAAISIGAGQALAVVLENVQNQFH
ncbi:thiolase family protein [Actinoplanes couchii]|uniref:thiolase family protein n=1 Tax=Actinoplanes couchii TaxID=403638 RepID=UPI0031DB33A1